MQSHSRATLAALFHLLLLTAPALARDIPCVPDDVSSAWSNPGRIFISPDGSGERLGDRGCTVNVLVQDCSLQPVANFPAQDIWLRDSGTADIWICANGVMADHDTDAAGMTTISGTMFGGGSTTGPIFVYLSGVPLWQSPLDIEVVSVDLNADLVVNMVDVAIFAVDFASPNPPSRSDFTHDGQVNLSDVGTLAIRLGVSCP